MSAPVQLVFCGEVLEGFQIDDVQRELGRALRADEPRLKQLFSGRRTVLKRGLAAADAQRYVSRLAAMGARVHVEAEPALAAPAASVATPAAAPVAPAVLAAPKALALVEAAAPDEVVCPNCGERQSKRLLCRSCGSNIEMAIAAKQEEEAQRRAERQAALEARRSSRRRLAGDAQSGERSAWPIGFSFSGRVGRLSSAAANLWLISALLLLTAGFLIQPSLPRALLVGTGVLAVFFFSMRLTVLRCHDCDRHGWWALFVLVPYAGSLASLLFGLVPGNSETNEYGPPPPKGSWRWLGLAVLVLVLSIGMLVRSSIRFAERYAEAASRESADEVIDLGGDANISGSSGSGAAALQDAYRDYLRAPGHKVFVASSRQNYAWVGNSDSLDDAARSAMSKCEAQRQPYTPSCRVLNVNNQPVRN